MTRETLEHHTLIEKGLFHTFTLPGGLPDKSWGPERWAWFCHLGFSVFPGVFPALSVAPRGWASVPPRGRIAPRVSWLSSGCSSSQFLQDFRAQSSPSGLPPSPRPPLHLLSVVRPLRPRCSLPPSVPSVAVWLFLPESCLSPFPLAPSSLLGPEGPTLSAFALLSQEACPI